MTTPTPQTISAAQAGRPGGAGIVGRETKRTENALGTLIHSAIIHYPDFFGNVKTFLVAAGPRVVQGAACWTYSTF